MKNGVMVNEQWKLNQKRIAKYTLDQLLWSYYGVIQSYFSSLPLYIKDDDRCTWS